MEEEKKTNKEDIKIIEAQAGLFGVLTLKVELNGGTYSGFLIKD
jgi:hypothetical protein